MNEPSQLTPQSSKQWQVPEQPQQVLGSDAYTSPAWFAAEQKALFRKSWVFAGVIMDLAQPGDYTTAQAGPYPLTAVRGRDGKLRGFHNICRHRGTVILDGAGNMAVPSSALIMNGPTIWPELCAAFPTRLIVSPTWTAPL